VLLEDNSLYHFARRVANRMSKVSSPTFGGTYWLLPRGYAVMSFDGPSGGKMATFRVIAQA